MTSYNQDSPTHARPRHVLGEAPPSPPNNWDESDEDYEITTTEIDKGVLELEKLMPSIETSAKIPEKAEVPKKTEATKEMTQAPEKAVSPPLLAGSRKRKAPLAATATSKKTTKPLDEHTDAGNVAAEFRKKKAAPTKVPTKKTADAPLKQKDAPNGIAAKPKRSSLPVATTKKTTAPTQKATTEKRKPVAKEFERFSLFPKRTVAPVIRTVMIPINDSKKRERSNDNTSSAIPAKKAKISGTPHPHGSATKLPSSIPEELFCTSPNFDLKMLPNSDLTTDQRDNLTTFIVNMVAHSKDNIVIEPTAHALFTTPYVFAVEVKVRIPVSSSKSKTVTLARYFLPSADKANKDKNKYVEINPKDVAKGVDPMRGVNGEEVPFMEAYCACEKGEFDEGHGGVRKVSMVENKMMGVEVYGEKGGIGQWCVGGVSRVWGCGVEEAMKVWCEGM